MHPITARVQGRRNAPRDRNHRPGVEAMAVFAAALMREQAQHGPQPAVAAGREHAVEPVVEQEPLVVDENPQEVPAVEQVDTPPAEAGENPEDGPFEIPGEYVSSWDWLERSVRSVKRAVMKCFCMDELVRDWDHEVKMDRAYRRTMLTTMRVPANRRLEDHLVEEVHQINAQQVHHIPKLVVEVTVALRCKLGMGAMDRSVPGNVSVVRAEAARLLRGWNVRKKDAAAHLVEIERCFFEDDTHYRVSTWRARGVRNSRFFRWFIGRKEPVGFDY